MSASEREQVAHRRDHTAEVVADRSVLVAVDAVLGEALTDPRRVRVDDLTEQQLRADGEDLAAHAGNLRVHAREHP